MINVIRHDPEEKQVALKGEEPIDVVIIDPKDIVDDDDNRRRQEEEQIVIDNENYTLAAVLWLEHELEQGSLPESDYLQPDYPDNQDGFVDYLWSSFPTDFGDGFGDGFWDVDPFDMGI